MWKVKYEIPPSSAVYEAEIHGLDNEKMVREFYKLSHPKRNVLKVTHLSEVKD